MTQTRIKEFAPILAVAGVGAALRLFHLGAHSIWLDEALTLIQSQNLKEALHPWLHPPGHYLVVHGWMTVFGTSRTAVRACSVLMSFFTLMLLVPVGERLSGKRSVGLLAAALLALMPLDIWYAREARMYAFWPLANLLMLYGLLGLDRNPIRKRDLLTYLGGIFLSISMHYYAVFYIFSALVGSLLLLRQSSPSSAILLKRFFRIHSPLVLIALFYWSTKVLPKNNWSHIRIGLEAGQHAFDLHSIAYGFSTLALMLKTPFVAFGFWQNLGISALLFALVFHTYGISMRKKSAYAGPLLLLTGLPFLLINLLPIRGKFAPYSIPTLSLLCLCFALAANSILDSKSGSPIRKRALCVLAVLLLPYISPGIHKALFDRSVEDWDGVCDVLNRETRPNHLVLIRKHYLRAPLSLCYRGKAEIALSGPLPTERRISEIPSLSRQLETPYEKVWVVSRFPFAKRRKELFQQLNGRYPCRERLEFRKLELNAFSDCQSSQ